MTFNNLSEILQNMYLLNFVMLFKLILILIFIFVSILIVKKFKPKASKYLMVSKVRLTYYVMAWLFIISIPFHFAYLSPKVELSTVLNPIITFYTVNFIVLGIIVALNIAIHGSAFISDLFDDQDRTKAVRGDFNKFIKEEPTLRK